MASCIRYRPEIDGLRAVAVIPVVLFHMGFQCVTGGFIGVDVFFVISGYLITSIILKEHEAGVFTFSNFWLRRVRRIFPALAAMLIATSLVGSSLIWKGDLHDLGKHGLAAILSFANIIMWQIPGGYWGASAENSLFLHTWSLSVEEQFYFVYPFIMVLFLGIMRKRILQGIGVIALCSFLLYCFGALYYPAAAFYLLPMRAWELAVGGLAAVLAWKGGLALAPSTASRLSLVGILAVILSYVFIAGENQFPGFLVIPVVGSALIILCNENNDTGVKRILSSSPLVAIGKISYSLYLWHWPILIFARQRPLIDNSMAATSITLSGIALAALGSYHFVEKPARHYRNIVQPALIALVASLGLSGYLYCSDFTSLYRISGFDPVLWSGQLYNVNPVDTWPEAARVRMEGINVPERDTSLASAYKTGGIIKQYGRPTPEVVVLGDSHVLMWSGVIDRICEELGVTVSFYGADGTPPFIDLPLKPSKGNPFFTPEEKYTFDYKRLDFIREWKPKVVVIATNWGEVKDIKVTEDLVRFIGDCGAQILLIEQPPVLFFGDKNALQYLSSTGVRPKDTQKQYVKTANMRKYDNGREIVQKISAQYPYCTTVPVMDVFYKAGAGSWVLDGSKVLYIDDDHLSQDGALKVKARIYKKIKDIIGL